MGIQSTSCYETRRPCYGVGDQSHCSCPAKYYPAKASAALRLRSNGAAFYLDSGRMVGNTYQGWQATADYVSVRLLGEAVD